MPSAQKRLERILRNECPRCGKPMGDDPGGVCPRCRKIQSANQQARRRGRIAKGICTECDKPSTAKSQQCEHHRLLKRAQERRNRLRKQKGIAE